MSATEALMFDKSLTAGEAKKRGDLRNRKPYIADKLAAIADIEEAGNISPIIRLEKSYLCNFQCTHCSAEYYMDRDLKKKDVLDELAATIHHKKIKETLEAITPSTISLRAPMNEKSSIIVGLDPTGSNIPPKPQPADK